MSIWYKIALSCSVFPLFAGLIILCLWWGNPSQNLEYAGLINIYSGLVFFVIGLVCLLMHHLSIRKSKTGRSVALPLILLLLNFPIAMGCVFAASYKYSQSTITIHNLSPHLIEEIVLQHTGGREYVVKDVSSGTKHRETLRFKSEGSVSYSMKANEQVLSGILFGYVMPSMGSHGVVTVDSTGKIIVEETDK